MVLRCIIFVSSETRSEAFFALRFGSGMYMSLFSPPFTSLLWRLLWKSFFCASLALNCIPSGSFADCFLNASRVSSFSSSPSSFVTVGVYPPLIAAPKLGALFPFLSTSLISSLINFNPFTPPPLALPLLYSISNAYHVSYSSTTVTRNVTFAGTFAGTTHGKTSLNCPPFFECDRSCVTAYSHIGCICARSGISFFNHFPIGRSVFESTAYIMKPLYRLALEIWSSATAPGTFTPGAPKVNSMSPDRAIDGFDDGKPCNTPS